jgi:hypothetical protein
VEVPSLAARRQVRRVIFVACASPLFLLGWWLILKVGAVFSGPKYQEQVISVPVSCVNAVDYAACVHAHDKPATVRAGALQLSLACDATSKGTGSEQIPKFELLISIDDDTFGLGRHKAGPIDGGTLSNNVQVGSRKITLHTGLTSPDSNEPMTITIYRDTWKMESAGRKGFSFSGDCQVIDFRPLRG